VNHPFISTVFLLTAGLTLSAAAAPVWRWSNPTPHGNNIVDMADHNGLTIQVAERGQIYASYDLDLWLPGDTHTTNALRAVTFFGERIVVTGERGTVLYADSENDFKTGLLLEGPTDNWLESVAASSNLVVAVGDNAAIYTSSDGINWHKQSPGFINWLRSVVFGPGYFVTVGEGGLIATSTNGTSWTKRASGVSLDLNKIIWAANRFYVVGDSGVILTSAAGLTWQRVTTSGATNALFSAVSGSNNALLVLGEDELRLLENSVWSNQLDASKPASAPSWTYYSGFARSNSFLVAGRTGLMIEGVKTNASGYSWIPLTRPIRNWLWDVAGVAGLYVTVGDHATIMTSDNGIDWTLENVPDSVTNSTFLGIGGTTNLLLAAGSGGSLVFSPNTTVTITVTNTQGTNTVITNQQVNTFGLLWNDIQPRPTTNDLQGVATFGDLFVVTGDRGTILTSSNGTNWTQRPSPTNKFLSSVSSSPNTLVAVGEKGVIVTSPDGLAWTLKAFGTTNWIYRVRYLGGQFIATGQDGLIVTSTNGLDWTRQSSGTTAWLTDVAFIDGTYFIVGTQGTVLTSTNAVDWANPGAITQKSLYGASTQAGQLIAVGIEGVILRSQIRPQLDPVRILQYSRQQSTNSIQNAFLFSGKPDQRFTLDRATDFTTWIIGPTLEFFDSSGTLLYIETVTNNPPKEFFRATLQP
jgi:hypothetical protein